MSPYENLPDSQWKKVTKKLVNEHPLSSDILIDTVLEAWNGILKTKIADELQIGRDIFPTPCKFCSNGTPILKLAVHPF